MRYARGMGDGNTPLLLSLLLFSWTLAEKGRQGGMSTRQENIWA
jgi:hypothetical protein